MPNVWPGRVGSLGGLTSEPLGCVGSGTASSASRYYRKGNVWGQFFTMFYDTEWVHNREPEQTG